MVESTDPYNEFVVTVHELGQKPKVLFSRCTRAYALKRAEQLQESAPPGIEYRGRSVWQWNNLCSLVYQD